MSEIDDIMRRSREARERIAKAGQRFEVQQRQLAKAEAILAEQEAKATQEAKAKREAIEQAETTILLRKRRLQGLPTTTNEIRRDILLILTRHNVFWAEVVSHGRRKNLDAPRREVYAYLRELGWSYPAIGRFCDRDHASIMHGVQKYKAGKESINE